MIVTAAVQMVVFVVPAEGGEEHPQIQPRDVHAIHVLDDLAQDRPRSPRQIVEIEPGTSIVWRAFV